MGYFYLLLLLQQIQFLHSKARKKALVISGREQTSHHWPQMTGQTTDHKLLLTTI